MDNAVAESFFSAVKQEEIQKKTYSSLDELYYALESYFYFYNNERLHTSLGNRTPQEVEEAFIGGEVKILD